MDGRTDGRTDKVGFRVASLNTRRGVYLEHFGFDKELKQEKTRIRMTLGWNKDARKECQASERRETAPGHTKPSVKVAIEAFGLAHV